MNKYAWLISLMPPFMSLVIIRTYLGSFDNAFLFTENLSGSGIFNFVFMFMMLTLAAFAVIFFLPSLIFSISVPKSTPKLHNYSDIKRKVTLSAILSIPVSVFWFFGWAYVAVRYPNHETLTGWACLLGGLMSVLLINYFCLRKPVSIARQYQSARLRIKTALTLYAASPALLLVVIALYFTFCIPIVIGWIDQKAAGDGIAMILKVSVLISGLGMLLLFPGAMYVVTEPAVRNSVWFVKFGAITVILWPLLTCMYVPSFYPVLVDKTMALAGISDWKTRRFQIDETKIPFSHFAKEEWQRVRTGGEKRFSVKGIMVYSLSNVKLLCPESIREPYRNMLRFVPWDRNYDKEKAAELKKASSRCQPFTQGGVIRLSE
ncbi:hypothetical protein [Enterobacter hormaechei]|uniref:hypothetical protein n=1 Tax=Enterobacter hormaechei TaxID=158836 RepID=UPI001EF85666|nr:hypothetical protein [Enterobacter hormaechei]